MTDRIIHLLNIRERWIAEYPGILAVDPTRAHHHLEAIADLELYISRLGPEGKSAIDRCAAIPADSLTTAHVMVAAHRLRLGRVGSAV